MFLQQFVVQYQFINMCNLRSVIYYLQRLTYISDMLLCL